MKKIIISGVLFVTGFIHAQTTTPSTTENYVYTKTYLSDPTLANPKTSEIIQYFDGLGRSKQVVNVKASPTGKDLVTTILYDGFGRQVDSWLPTPMTTLNGGIQSAIDAAAQTYYNDNRPFTHQNLENSPLDRAVSQVQTGTDWSTKPVKFDYNANIDGEVKKYIATFDYAAFTSKLVTAVPYGSNQLYKNSVTDEDSNQTVEFKNGQGQTILVRKMLNATESADTYYIYNDYNQLAFVIPPNAADALKNLGSGVTISPTDPILTGLCYQYKYDGRNRLVEKKLPGKGWEYMVYDKQDRLVLTRDANLDAKGQWLFTKYDQLSRPIYTGILDSPPGRIQQVVAVEGQGSNNETRSTSSWNNSGIDVFYTTNGAYPAMNFKVLTVNYYDTYPAYSFNPTFTPPTGATLLTDTPSTDAKSTKALPVMSLVKNIEDDNWTKNYTYYDTKGRAIGTYSINYLGGFTESKSELDFVGIPKKTITRHKRLDTDTEKVITENFEYDTQNRLLVHKHQVDSNTEEILTQNKYNELSQLESKKVGGTNAATPLQIVDYAYNIRGWMTRINDPANLNGKLFAYEMKYNNPTNTSLATGRYNGNIAEINWKTSQDDVLKRYSYQYDPLNRLKKGLYSEPGIFLPENGFFNEELSYDLNGNIANLQRNNKGIAGLEQIDDITYQYTGNRLTSVSDSSGNYLGYPDSSGNTIAYDDNGNMKDQIDKGILNITYNYLNLPDYIKFDVTYVPRLPIGDNNVNTRYLYRADGVKLQKYYTFGSGRANLEANKITEYLDGFQYEKTVSGGTLVVQKLKFVPTSEGYFNFENNKYIYNYSDHLGNVRISYFNNGSGAEIIEENNYYPFGLKYNAYNGIGVDTAYKYQYNGKELQEETGMYDYGARFYMPDLGRWGVVDELAEKSRRFSPYTYALDNPVMFVDPDGREAQCCGNLWNLAKTYYSGMYQGGKAVVKETYQGIKQLVTDPVGTAKAIYNNPGGVLKAGLNKGVGMWVATRPGTLVSGGIDAVKTGDASKVGNLAGRVLTETAMVAGTEGVGSSIKGTITAAKTARTMSKLATEVNTVVTELKESGKFVATVSGAELNGKTIVGVSADAPSVIADQLKGVVDELGGLNARPFNSGGAVGCCSEFHNGNQLLLDNPNALPSDINFTEAIRPRNGKVIPMCDTCKATFGK